MKLCAHVLEYDLQFLDVVQAAPARTQGKFGIFVKKKKMGAQGYVYQKTRTIIFLLLCIFLNK